MRQRITIMWAAGLATILWAAPNATDLANEWTTGFGNANLRDLLPTSGFPLLGNIILANLVQLLMSITYLAFNGLFTCLVVSSELLGCSAKRSGLRVSNPQGQFQRSSYFLTLPYKFSIPLLILSGTIHWILSQAIFLVQIKAIRPDGVKDDNSSLTCLGYSELAIIVALVLGFIMILAPALLGWIRYNPGAPVVESSSLAISAACHHDGEQTIESQQLLKYGVMAGSENKRVGLSSGSVSALVPGQIYPRRETPGERPQERRSRSKPSTISRNIHDFRGF